MGASFFFTSPVCNQAFDTAQCSASWSLSIDGMGPWFVRTGARKQSSSPDMGVAHAVAVVVTLLGVCEVRAIPRGHLRKPQTSQPWQQEGSPLSRVPVTTPPAPPRQTPFQHSLLSRVDVEAAEAAKAAIPVLLERLEESSFRTALGR